LVARVVDGALMALPTYARTRTRAHTLRIWLREAIAGGISDEKLLMESALTNLKFSTEKPV